MIHKISAYAPKFAGLSYSLKFILRMAALYLLFRLTNYAWVVLTVPTGFYSPFIDQYLNYITLIRVTVLHTASWMADLFGVSSTVVDVANIQIEGSRRLHMGLKCCGLEIMCIWAAFTIADTTPLRTKIMWCLGGFFCIWLINCIRVAVLMIALKNEWGTAKAMSHHDTFNIAAYGLIMILMFIYYKRNQKQFGGQTA